MNKKYFVYGSVDNVFVEKCGCIYIGSLILEK